MNSLILQMVDFIQQRFHGGTSVPVVTLNDVSCDTVWLFGCVRDARFQSLDLEQQSLPSHEKGTRAPVNQLGIKSII